MESDILLKAKYEKVLPLLKEKQIRMLLAAEAESMGTGGLYMALVIMRAG